MADNILFLLENLTKKFEKYGKKSKQILAGLRPAPPQRDP